MTETETDSSAGVCNRCLCRLIIQSLVQIKVTRRPIQLLLSYQMEHNDLYGQPRAELHQFAL